MNKLTKEYLKCYNLLYDLGKLLYKHQKNKQSLGEQTLERIHKVLNQELKRFERLGK